MTRHLAVIGAGVMGRVAAALACRAGWQVTLYERGTEDYQTSCSHVAGGLLTPFSERMESEQVITSLGLHSLELWPQVLADLRLESTFCRQGSLVTARRGDEVEVERFATVLKKVGFEDDMAAVIGSDLDGFAPGLSETCQRGFFLRREGHIDSQSFMTGSTQALRSLGVKIDFEVRADVAAAAQGSDAVIDCRGYEAEADLADLMPIRGEIIAIRSDCKLSLPLRIMHPRFPLYVAPRPGGRQLIGATSYHTDADHEVTVESALEILNAASTLLPSFRHAKIEKLSHAIRPAFPDHKPRITTGKEGVAINGLYRHGYLLAPALAEIGISILNGDPIPSAWEEICR